MRALVILILVGGWVAAEPPVKMAEQARLQLKVGEGGRPLEDLSLTVDGSWMDPGALGGTENDMTFPIDHWRWTSVTIRFRAPVGERVDLHLIGPWEEESAGEVWRQEVLWDDIAGKGTTVINGGFEEGIDGWTSPWAPFPAAGEWPLDGRAVGASWLGRPLVQSLEVVAGQEVELSLRARAAVPAGVREMKKQSGETPAHRWAARIKRGVNLGNCWEAPVGSWGVPYTVEDIDRIAAMGFDHVRVPVGWHHRISEGVLSADLLGELEPVLKRALDRKLRVILDWHSYRELEENPDRHQDEFLAGWKLLAGHFKDWPDELAFEILNEPARRLVGERLNELHTETLKVIRAVDRGRVVFIDPGKWASADQMGRLWLPDDEDRVIVSFHCYDPFPFTHQEAAWVDYQNVKDIRFPGPPDPPQSVPESPESLRSWFEAYHARGATPNPSSIASVNRLLAKAKAWSETYGRPVHLGEWGCVKNAEEASRKRYASEVRRAIEEHGIPWCWWEWKVGFGVVDLQSGQPLLIDELTGK